MRANGNFSDASLGTVAFSVSQYNRVMSPSDAVDLESLLVYAFLFFWS